MKVIIDIPLRLSADEADAALVLRPKGGGYVSRDPAQLLIVVLRDVELEALPQGTVVDAETSWWPEPDEEWNDAVHSAYVLKQNRGKRHKKLTIHRISEDKGETTKLSEIVSSAPRADQPGGYRGTQGRKKKDMKQVLLRLTPERLKTFRELGGQSAVYSWLDQQAAIEDT
jgi:hypothetical protein